MGDEFALLDPEDGRLYAFPRAVSLKNGAISVVAGIADETRLGPLLTGTPKGSIRHLRPRAEALERMAEPAKPTLILFPRSEEHTSELQSLMRISYAVFCLKKKNITIQ